MADEESKLPYRDEAEAAPEPEAKTRLSSWHYFRSGFNVWRVRKTKQVQQWLIACGPAALHTIRIISAMAFVFLGLVGGIVALSTGDGADRVILTLVGCTGAVCAHWALSAFWNSVVIDGKDSLGDLDADIYRFVEEGRWLSKELEWRGKRTDFERAWNRLDHDLREQVKAAIGSGSERYEYMARLRYIMKHKL